MKNKLTSIFALAALFATPRALASVESSLGGIQTVLLGSILPSFAVIGLGFAAFSFIIGSQDAKRHLTYAVIGCVVLFGAQSIVDLIERVVR